MQRMVNQSGPWRPDWLTLRYSPPPIENTHEWTDHALGILSGAIVTDRLDRKVGHTAMNHGALAVSLTGTYWELRAAEQCPDRLSPIHAWCSAHSTSTSASRIDWCANFRSEDVLPVLDIGKLLIARWPWAGGERDRPAIPQPHYQASTTGESAYVGFAGTDPDRYREREVCVRIYTHHEKRPGVTRVEVECKRLDGLTVQDQLDLSRERVAAIATALGLPHDLPPLEVSAQSAKRTATPEETAARALGMMFNHSLRLGHVAGEREYALARQLVSHLGLVELDQAHRTVRRAARAHLAVRPHRANLRKEHK